MAETISTIKTKISLVLQDTPSFIGAAESGEMEEAIRQALDRYSSDAPRAVVDDIAGDGSTFDLTLDAAYLDGFSRIVSVEYPAGERYPVRIDGNEWSIYRTSSTTRLRLLGVTPGSSETVRVTFTALHTLDGFDSAAATTIPAWHTSAFVNLAVAQCLYILAARFLHEQETTLNADSVDRNSKSDQARRLAGAFIKAYEEQVGVSGGQAPASVVRDWDARLYRGYGGLTHRRGDV